MRLYTSYFAKMSKLGSDGKLFVSIAVAGVPKWFPYTCLVYPKLAPSWDLVMGIKNSMISWSEYEHRYYKEKDFEHNRLKYMVDLMKLSELHGGKDLVLLCFERSGDNCHRHLVAKQLNAIEL